MGLPPTTRAEDRRKEKATENKPKHKHPRDPLRSIHGLHREIPPVWLLVVPSPSDAGPSHMLGRARKIQSRIREDEDGDDILLEQPDDENELGRSAEKVWKGSGESQTYHVVVIGMPPIRRALRRLLLAVLPLTEDTMSRLVIRVDGLHQRVGGREQEGQ